MQKSNLEIEQILSEYKPLVLKLAKGYYIQGGDIEDLIQEGMIALYSCTFSYDETKSSFSTYAYIAISSRLKNVVKHSFSKNQRVLSDAVEIDDDLMMPREISIEDQYILKEEMSLFRRKMEMILSKREFEVMDLFLNHMTYEEIAEKLGIQKKAVDNALSRARKKIAENIGLL